MSGADVFHRDFKPRPYWWEAFEPKPMALAEVPKSARVAIVGAGYAGISTAIELANAGIEAVVLEAKEPGWGASTRSGGAVSGGVNVGKSFSGRTFQGTPEQIAAVLNSAADAFSLIESLIEREEIDCFWQKHGRFVGAWTPGHYENQAKRIEKLNRDAQSGSYMVPRERQREEIASDYYYGGMVVERAAKLHPALYFKGLLDAARRRGVTICAQAPVERIARNGSGWEIRTGRGTVTAGDVVIATNGYTGDATPQLKRRLIPVASHIIATEELPPDLAKSLIPKGRTLSDTRRVLCYYRMSPDGKRVIFGGRARFTAVTPEVAAPILHGFMTERFPQLQGTKVTHAWNGNVAFTFDALPHTGRQDGMHYALGCNGSGVAMMTYLGHQTARRIIGGANRPSGFELPEFPDHPLYSGNPWFLPVVGSWYRFRDWYDRRVA
ncbi:NAD(P)/FAD-dependent oxidoreductase [Stella sp.]|uniref:NAD(P)/FAD-dependent oxidoreductase n=1 Tax=Stella sp. TaxID=2912054 RepID=UPI0035AF332F